LTGATFQQRLSSHSFVYIHDMHKRFHGQRQHVVYSLDVLLYQLHTLSFFLSPSIWIYLCRILSQFQYSKPRELDPTRSLRFYYTMVLLFNLPSIWYHSTREVVDGRIVILDFIGMSYTPSRIQLCLLDLFICGLQVLLTTIAYETSIYYTSDESDPHDILLPSLPASLPIPLFQSPAEGPLHSNFAKTTSFSSAHDIPLVIDLHLNSIMTHIRHPPPPPRVTQAHSILPIPNSAQWIPGMQILLRATGQMREPAGVRQTPVVLRRASREGRVPGGYEAGSEQ